MRLVLLGPPGAGKGTQGDLLAGRLGVLKISTGDLLRRHAEAATPLGIRARPHLDSGTLVPDDVAVGVVAGRLREPDTTGFILDGFPRTLRQAHDIEQLLQNAGQPLDRVIEFRLSREDVVERLSGRRLCVQCGRIWHLAFDPPARGRCGECGGDLTQRADDQPATIEHRLDVYDQQTVPLIEHYRSVGLLAAIDATGPVESVLAETMAVLGPAQSADS